MNSTPIFDALRHMPPLYPFHMPGHKGRLPYEIPLALDTTEHEDFDDLHAPNGAIAASERNLAAYYGTMASFYLVGGATAGILAAIYAVTREGDKIAAARNCHRSVYHAAELRGLDAAYIMPEIRTDINVCGAVSPESVAAALDGSGAKLAIITSPTYEGYISDVAVTAEVCHFRGVALIVDEAHGAHLHLSDRLPQSAVGSGADIVVQSLHKTLPAPSSCALLHVCSDRVDLAEMRRSLAVFQTSSPCYPLAAASELCVDYVKREGGSAMAAHLARLDAFYTETERLQNLRVLRPDDPTKIIISTRGASTSGRELADMLRRHGFRLEMSGAEYVLALTGICDTDAALSDFAAALHEIDKNIKRELKNIIPLDFSAEIVYNIKHALACRREAAPLSESVGRVCAGYVYAYPPGIPYLIPGQRISAAAVTALKSTARSGVIFRGTEDGKITVTK